MRKRLSPGDRFGMLTYVEDAGHFSGKGGRKKRLAVYECDCGNRKALRVEHVTSGNSKSCGCLQKACLEKLNLSHGHARRGRKTSREYVAWCHMRARCSKETKDAAHYKDRGISVCERWDTYELFLQDMGPKPTPRHSLDRIDNSKGYCPENCRWATHTQQMRNTRRTVFLTLNGEKRCISEWAEISKVPAKTIQYRVSYGWPIEHAIWAPVGRKLRELV